MNIGSVRIERGNLVEKTSCLKSLERSLTKVQLEPPGGLPPSHHQDFALDPNWCITARPNAMPKLIPPKISEYPAVMLSLICLV